MRIIKYILIILFIISCKRDTLNKKQILIAENNLSDLFNNEYILELYSDSTYMFTLNENQWEHEKHEIFRGRYLYVHDSILFSPFEFTFTNSTKAIIRNNFIDFLNGERPFRMKILKTVLLNEMKIDTVKFKDYSVFPYDSNFYYCFPKTSKSIDLSNQDLVKIDSIINLCIKQNKRYIPLDSKEYCKQLIPVLNDKNEKEVWVNLLCKKSRLLKDYLYNIINVDDGGACFINLKINLEKLVYLDLRINGKA